MNLTHEQAVAFFSEFYGGTHRIPGARYKAENIKPYGTGWSVSHPGELASFDSDQLTTLVLLAHERCIRVHVEPCNPRYLRIVIFGRVREGDISRRHPTIGHAVALFDRVKGLQ
jgi:hypothetical protein